MPLFSIVIPTYNRRDLVSAALDSAIAQEYDDDYEILVGDDGSTDGTPDFIRERYGDRVRVFNQPNAGPGPARNLAAQHATGEYLALLDSDDAFTPWALATYAELIELHDRPSLFIGAGHETDDLSAVGEVRHAALDTLAFDNFYESRLAAPLIATDRLTVRRDVFERLGGFTDRVVNGEDVDFFLRAGVEPGYAIIREPVTFLRRKHGNQISRNLGPAYEGRMFLLDREADGGYPGGDAYRRHRREVLSFWARVASNQMARGGELRKGWDFYRRVFGWHVRLGRWKYLLGYPLVWLRAALTGPRKG